MKVYTGKGDTGETSLFTGERVKKYDRRVNTMGEIDELCSYLGLVKTLLSDELCRAFVHSLQMDLFNILSLIASGNDAKYFFDKQRATVIEQEIDRLQKEFPREPGFVVPGKTTTSAHIDIARTVARRAERRVSELISDTPLDPTACVIMNRLSDYLFILARYTELE